MENNVVVTINQDKYNLRRGSSAYELLKTIDKEDEIIAISINGEIQELSYIFNENKNIELISVHSRIGKKIYRCGLKFIYIVAVKELYGEKADVQLLHSLDKGIYSVLNIGANVDIDVVNNIISKMKDIITKDLLFSRTNTKRDNAIKYFESINEKEKVINYRQTREEVVVLYQLLSYYNYFYYSMPYSTGIIKYFNLELIGENEVMLEYPSNKDNNIPAYCKVDKVLNEFDKYHLWADKVNVNYVSDINNKVINGKINEFIQLNEIRHNNELQLIAKNIKDNKKNVRIVLIGGPSSSGKTTSSNKLALYLKGYGINPFVISVDNYFKEREDTQKDIHGNYIFDTLESIDTTLFNDHLNKLLNNECISIPEFNFITGKKEFKNSPISLEERDIIIIEGLHTLNEELTKNIKKENKVKIYISPFTPLGLDKHNHVSTVDSRFLRRLVRDNRQRGYSAEDTLTNWRTVRKAEEEAVFPYQSDADFVYNTALIYETGVLKTYALPLLYSIDEKSKNYSEALRLINFLKPFFNIPADAVPSTSLLREFIGNSYFE
ncbi:MAG: nucleoside kinase [Bacilli bacterium]